VFVLHAVFLGQHRFVINYSDDEPLSRLHLFAGLFTFGLVPLWLAARAAARIPPVTSLSIILVVFGAVSLAAILTSPTRSQDLNLNLLLAKGFTAYGMNPYQTAPLMLQKDPWSPPSLSWSGQPMTHGPVWVLLLVSITACTYSLRMAFVLVKLTALVALAAGGIFLWKIMALQGRAVGDRAGVLAILAWNPFVLQTALVDAHNDVLILVAILASYLCFLTRRYRLSIMALMLGGFVKFALWPLMLVPVAYLVKERGMHRGAVCAAVLLLSGAVLASALYAPFGLSAKNFAGLTEEVMERGWTSFYWPGTALLGSLPWMGIVQIRVAGLLMGLLVLGMCIRWDRPLLGYTLPYAVMLFFGSPSFHPWYGLWVAPLASLLIAPAALLILSVPLIVDELAPRWALWIVTFGLLAIFGVTRLVRSRRPASAGG